MSYKKPSVLVYQELQNAGGVANVTPDLGCTVVGPLYNIVRADVLSPVSMNATLTKTIVSQSDFKNNLGVTLTAVEVPLSQAKPGQIVDTTSVVMHVRDAWVRTTSFEYNVGDDNAVFLADNKSRFVVGKVTSGNYTVDTGVSAQLHDRPFDELLPDSSGAHISEGYIVEISYDDPDVGGATPTVLQGVITEVVRYDNTVLNKKQVVSFKTSVPVPEFTANTTVSATVRIFKNYPYLVLPNVDSQFSFASIDYDIVKISTATSLGVIGFKSYTSASITSSATTASYLMVTGKISPSYKAVRQDTFSTILAITTTAERESYLGEATEDNPLALATQIALENTTKAVFALSLKKTGGAFEWSRALELLEGHRSSYALVPLTQDKSILTSFLLHSTQLSTPEMASWRVTIGSTAIPSTLDIVAEVGDTNTSGTCKTVAGTDYLSDLTETFVAKGVTPGDLVVITDTNNATPANVKGTYVVDEVVNNTVLKLTGFSGADNGNSLTYYIIRTLTRRQRADQVALNSAVFGSNRFWHVQPDIVGVKVQGVTKYLPGYYLCAALGGLTSGEAIQQGFTNMVVAGITDLQNSNFYFNREELGVMAAAGVCLYVQDTQDGTPYCRHALTTDVTVLEYREILKVKNWDFLSFFFHDKLKGFIGKWNITPDTLSNMKQVINASIELLKGQKLPKIGPPLLSGTILLLQQNAVNKDNVDIRLKIEIVSPNNYTNLYLVI